MITIQFLHMKILYISIIIILTSSLIIVNNNVFADNSIKPVIIDGHITPKGCSKVNGTVTQAKDMQNTTVQICNFSNKHFKLSEESLCLASMEMDFACDLPVPCGSTFSTIGYMSQGDKIPIHEGVEQYIYTIYPVNMCVSEAYDEQEKKITLIANGSQYNFSNSNLHYSITVLIPKGLLENVTYTVDGKYPVTHVNDNLDWLAKNHTGIQIDLPLSFDTKKIEIMGNNKIPEFPISIPILLIGISIMIIFYRMKSSFRI